MTRNGSIRLPSPGGYSADVRLLLRVNGRLHPLAQIGPDRIVLCEAAALPEGPAEIIMHVDDATERWEVDLHQADPAECGVPIRLRD